jgi:acyl-CoA thioester hydrolase
MDFNAHMANTAYLNMGADTRLAFFQAHGFPVAEFHRQRFGPVVFKDELEYFKELRLMDAVEVTLEAAGLSTDGSRFRLRDTFFNEAGQMCARLTTTGAWLDLEARKLRMPPSELAALLANLARTEDFEALGSR